MAARVLFPVCSRRSSVCTKTLSMQIKEPSFTVQFYTWGCCHCGLSLVGAWFMVGSGRRVALTTWKPSRHYKTLPMHTFQCKSLSTPGRQQDYYLLLFAPVQPKETLVWFNSLYTCKNFSGAINKRCNSWTKIDFFLQNDLHSQHQKTHKFQYFLQASCVYSTQSLNA